MLLPMLPEEQAIKLFTWVGFTIGVPLAVYPAAAVTARLESKPITVRQLLELGDLLFLVIVLLATICGTVLQAYMAPPAGAVLPRGFWKVVDYGCCLAALLSLIVYSLVYGRIIMYRLTGTSVQNMQAMALLSVNSYIGAAVLCTGLYYRFLYCGIV